LASASYLRSMRPLLRTTLAGDDRGPRALAAFSMLIGVYLVVRAIGLDPLPSLVSRLSGEAEGSTVVAAVTPAPSATAPRVVRATHGERGRAVRVTVPAHTKRAKATHPRRRAAVERRPEAQPSSGEGTPAPTPAPTPTPAPAPAAAPAADPTSDKPKTQDPDPQAPAPVADPAPIVPPAPPAHLPDPPTVTLPDPTAAVDPGTLTPPVALPVEPPLPTLPSLP
jgi:hypothetical protein